MTDRHDITPEEALARTKVRIKVEGLEAASDAALKLLRDPHASATGQERHDQCDLPCVGSVQRQ